MKSRRRVKSCKSLKITSTRALQGAAILAAALSASSAARAIPPIDATNWGDFTAPVFGVPETSVGGIYSNADLFAGPNNGRFADGNYYHGVIPDGKIVNPAGTSIQIGSNPLGAALTPDGKYLIVSNDDEREGIGYNYSTPGGTPLTTPSLQSNIVVGGYSLAVVDTASMKVVSVYQNTADRFYLGLQVTGNSTTGYTVYASGGADETVKVFSVTPAGVITKTASITPPALTPKNAGYVSNYTPDASFAANAVPRKPVGSQFSRTGATITFPAGSALSRNGFYLYVALNTDNSVAVIDTRTNTVVQQVKVGFFPYAISVSADGSKVTVSNWGISEYKFLPGYAYNGLNQLTTLPIIGPVVPLAGQPGSLFYLPPQTKGKSSSVMVFSANEATTTGTPLAANPIVSVDESKPLDNLAQVGDTHPSATAIVKRGGVEVLYVAKANSDALGLIVLNNYRALPDLDLSPVGLTLADGHKVHGSYPNALVASADGTRLYVAEAGTNTVAVLDTSSPASPKLIGRYTTGWYPTALALDTTGNNLYVLNAKGVGEDINPFTNNGDPTHANPTATGVQSEQDSNYIFGSLQKIPLTTPVYDPATALSFSVAYHPATDTTVVPAGTVAGGSKKIKHVIFILHENKTFDSMLGNRQDHYGNFAGTTFNYIGGSPGSAFAVKLFGNYNATSHTFDIEGTTFTSPQYTGIDPNTQLLATTFASAVNYYSNSEESDAGHQYSASGTASDYTEKTLLTKTGRGMFANKNFEPEDYPEGGYIFNNAARNGVSFKDYGALVRVQGTDTGANGNVTVNGLPLATALGWVEFDDPTGMGVTGVPSLNVTFNQVPAPAYTYPVPPGTTRNNIPGINTANVTGTSLTIGSATGNPANQALSGTIVLDGSGRVVNTPALPGPTPGMPGSYVPGSDVTSPTQGDGQTYSQQQPILEILGENNASGEPHIDVNYPGYNFNISDRRRALEFIKDFDRMLNAGTLPTYIYLYQPNDHTGTPAVLGFTTDSNGNVTGTINATGPQLVADGDTGLGMVVSHIMKSPIYYTPESTPGAGDDTGAAILFTYDDAQSTEDHIHQHRTPLIVVSPFAKVQTPGTVGNGYVARHHYVTASVVKTEELLLGLPPNNLGDLLATDLRDLFQDTYNGITESMLDASFSQVAKYVPTPAGRKVWALASKLNTATPDQDSHRLGVLNRLTMQADDLYKAAVKRGHLHSKQYMALQARIYKAACAVANSPAPRDSDD